MEYLNPIRMRHFSERLGLQTTKSGQSVIDEDKSKYLQGVMNLRTTSNGIFSMNLHLVQWILFHHQEDSINLNENVQIEALEKWFPNPHLVFIRRKDIILQAVSLTIAQQTQAWSSEKVSKGKSYYNFDILLRNLKTNIIINKLWQKFKSQTQLPYLDIVYEEFSKDFLGQLRKIHNFVGISPNGVDQTEQNPIKKQRNRQSLLMGKRFVEELRSKGLLNDIIKNNF